MSVPAQPPRGESSQPQPAAPVAHPTPSSSPLADEAQAFLDAAFSGALSDEDDGAGAATPDADEATPATPGSAEPAEVAAEETQQQPTRREGSRRAREQAARAQAQPPEPEPADPAPEPAAPATPQRSEEQIIADWQARQESERTAREAAERERTAFAEWTGDVPADPANPTGPTRYQQLLADANLDFPEIDYATEPEAYNVLVRKRNAAREALRQHDFVRSFLERFRGERIAPVEQQARSEALSWVGTQFERGLADAGVDVQAVLGAGVGKPEPMPAIVKALASSLRTAIEGEYKPRIAELEEETAAKDSEIDALRRQLGGRAPNPERGGTPVQPAALSVEALDAIPLSQLGDELGAYLDLLPPAPSRRR